MPHAPIINALEQLAAALDTRDPKAAAQAAKAVGEAQAVLELTGASLDSATLAAAAAVFRRCEEGAARTSASLRASLLQASLHRRAIATYREP